MEERLAWAHAACARILRPVVKLALAMGLKHTHLEQLLRDLLLDEARGIWLAKGIKRPNVSQLSITTGLNRKAVSARVRDNGNALPATETSAASKTFTLWLQMATDDPACRQLPVIGNGFAMSFETLARVGSRGNVHHRTVLDELVRLGMATESGGYAELVSRGFVPSGDLQAMLAFLGDNARDHLMAAVANTLGNEPRFLERAVFSTGVTLGDCEKIQHLVRQRWDRLHHDLAAEMTGAVDRAPEGSSGRIRVGIYTYFEDEGTAPLAQEQGAVGRNP